MASEEEKEEPHFDPAAETDSGGEAPQRAEPGEDDVAGAEAEGEFDLEAQIEAFRQQIEAEPENCIHYYNLGEALAERGDRAAAKAEFENALKYDVDGGFSSVIHFGYGETLMQELVQGASAQVIKSSVGLATTHRDKLTITEVIDADYEAPLKHFEAAVRDLGKLKADEEIVAHIAKACPFNIAMVYYKWGSDLLDKARQLVEYGDEIKDVQRSLKYLKKTLEIDPNHSAAKLMAQVAKKMLVGGWESFDEFGFPAKKIEGLS
jgi:tetratricopeptide (TPR) repeat protein